MRGRARTSAVPPPDLALRPGKPLGTSPQSRLNPQRNVDPWDSLDLNCSAIDAIEPLSQVASA